MMLFEFTNCHDLGFNQEFKALINRQDNVEDFFQRKYPELFNMARGARNRFFSMGPDPIFPCRVDFLTQEEMKKFETKKINYLSDLMKDVSDLIDDIEELPPGEREPFEQLLRLLKRLLEMICHKEMVIERPGAFNEMREAIKDIIGEYMWEPEVEIFRIPNDRIGNKRLRKKLKDLAEELDFIALPVTLLGCYTHDKGPVIHLCPANILDEQQQNKNINFIDFLEAVLVHETTHYLHDLYSKVHKVSSSSKKKFFDTKVSAVKETLAEYVEWDFWNELKMPPKWMVDHMNAHPFPGWGYAGAKILIEYEEKTGLHGKMPLWLLRESGKNWEDTYAKLLIVKELADL